MFNIPCNYDTYLREYFGDYMQLPPLNKRVSHNYGIEPITRCNHIDSLEWNECKLEYNEISNDYFPRMDKST